MKCKMAQKWENFVYVRPIELFELLLLTVPFFVQVGSKVDSAVCGLHNKFLSINAL